MKKIELNDAQVNLLKKILNNHVNSLNQLCGQMNTLLLCAASVVDDVNDEAGLTVTIEDLLKEKV